jgi:hypothetical protein
MENIVNSKYSNKLYCKSNEYYKNCINLSLILNELKLAKNGIDNLKFTYKSDINIGSQLDILIVKIDTTIKDMSHKLTFFQNYLPDHLKAELLEEQRKLEPHYNMNIEPIEQIESTSSVKGSDVYQQLLDETDKPSWGDDNFIADDDSTSPLDMTDI